MWLLSSYNNGPVCFSPPKRRSSKKRYVLSVFCIRRRLLYTYVLNTIFLFSVKSNTQWNTHCSNRMFSYFVRANETYRSITYYWWIRCILPLCLYRLMDMNVQNREMWLASTSNSLKSPDDRWWNETFPLDWATLEDHFIPELVWGVTDEEHRCLLENCYWKRFFSLFWIFLNPIEEPFG